MILRPVILPAKVLANGSHRIRIAISHNGQTRYFMTRFTVPSPSNLRNGQVVGVNDASYINQQLRIRMNNIYRICDSCTDIEYYTCSQLVAYISKTEEGKRTNTLKEITDHLLLTKAQSREGTQRMYREALSVIMQFFGPDFLLRTLTSEDLHRCERWMVKTRGYSQTTVFIYMGKLRSLVNYAIRQKFVHYDVDPFTDYHEPMPRRRECSLTLDELRRIRDYDPTRERNKSVAYVRDLFMLSFYLCGMNLRDIINADLLQDKISYCRWKTINKRKNPTKTVFTIQPEARAIINRITRNGSLYLGKERKVRALQSLCRNRLHDISKRCDIESQLVFYSARKTFAQLANALFIKDSIIEYCLGDTISQSRRVIGFYINVTPRMADLAIRKIFDAVASDKSFEQLQEEAVT